jgi:O-antigen/teichoic acid export membrane protein
MHLSTRVAYNTIVQIASRVISTALGLISVAIMTRYLGKSGFGEYTTIITFISFFSIAIDWGLTLVTAQMISRPGVDQNKIVSNLFSLRLASAAVFLAMAPLVVFFFPYGPTIKLGVAIAALAFLFSSLNQIFIGIFQKNLRLDKVSLSELLGRVILLMGVIMISRLNYGLIGIMVVTVISSAVNCFLLYIFSGRFVRIAFDYDKAVWREIFKKSWPIALTIFFNLIYLKTDTLILSLIKTQSEVGIYGAAYRVIEVLITIPFMFAGVILPIITAAWAENNLEQFKKVFQKSFDFMAILALPLSVGAQFLAKPIMILVAGEEFADAGAALQILILASSIIFLGSMFAHGIIAIDKQKKIISAYIFTSVAAVAGYLIFIPRYSYFGAAWMTVGSELAIVLASAYLVWKNTKIFPNLKVFFKSLSASLVMATALFLFTRANGWHPNLFVALILAAIIYFISLYIFRGITKKDLVSLMPKPRTP